MAGSFDVFFSYSTRDHAPVERVARELTGYGISVFLDRWYLTPGQPWPQALEQTLAGCGAVAVFIGAEGLGPWQQRERDLALDRQGREPGFPVIPVLLTRADPALGFLRLNTWVDLSDDLADPETLAILTAAIRGEPPGPLARQRSEVVRAAVCPYRGLQPFREEDEPFFFGRTSFAQTLTATVLRHPFVAVVGASGSGKSSVVRAGLIPRLRRGAGNLVWDAVTLVPTDRPLISLSAALLPLLEPDLSEVTGLAEVADLASLLQTGKIALRDVAARALAKQPGTDRLLLFVDQWEEVYTLGNDTGMRQAFIGQLLSAAATDTIRVVLTVRGDFMGRALENRDFADQLQDGLVTIGPMTRDELAETIVEPAAKTGLSFEAGLAETILDDLGEEPGGLPLLEFLLEGLWAQRRGGLLTHDAHVRLGRVSGAIAHRAEEVFERSLNDAERQAARRLLVRMVRPGEGVEDTRRRAAMPDADAVAVATIQKLAKERLVVTERDGGSGQVTVEVAHEALIRRWQRLRDWIDADREFLRTRERVAAQAQLWEAEGCSSDWLLPPGRLLAEGEDLLQTRRADLEPLLVTFIKAAATAARANERRRRRHTGALMVVMAIITLLAIGGAVVGWRQSLEANRNAELAQLNERKTIGGAWAARALDIAGAQGSEAIKLAIAAAQLSLTPQAHRALLKLTEQGVPLAGTLPTDSSSNVMSVALSPDDRIIAFASLKAGSVRVTAQDLRGDAAVQSVEMAAPKSSSPCARPTTDLSLRFSPSSNYVLISTNYGTCVWDFRRHTVSWDLPGIEHAKFDTEERLLVGARSVFTDDVGTMVMFDGTSRRMIRAVPGRGWVNDLDISARGDMAIARSTGRVTIIHTDGGEKEFSCGGARAQAKAVQFDQSGATLAIGTTDGQVCMVTTDHGEQLWSSSTTSGVVHLTFSHEGSRLATQSENGTVAVWAAGDGSAILKLSTTGYPNGIAFAGPGDRYLVTANRGDDVRVWSVATGSPVGKIPRNTDSDAFDTGTGLAAAVGSDGDVLVWQIDGRAGRWSLDLGEEIEEIRKAESSSTLSARGYATVKVWDASRARELVSLKQPPEPPYGHFERVAVSPDGTMFAALLSTGKALFYKLPAGRQQFALSVPTSARIGIQSDNTDQYRFSVALHSIVPSEPLVMCTSGPAPLIDFSQANPKLPEKVWEECVAETGILEGTFATDLWRGLITFSPDGKLAAVAILNNLLIVDTSNGKTLGTLKHGYEHRPDPISHVMPFGFLPTVIKNVAFCDGSSRALTISSAGVARSWSGISSDSRLIETRELPAGHVFPPENGQFIYVYNPSESIILQIDPINLSEVDSVKAERPIDYVRSFGDHKEFLLKVSHDPAEFIIMGKGAVGVPYYVEVSRGLAGERLARWQFDAPLRSIALSPNEESIVVGDTRGSIHVMAWKSGDVITWNEGPLAAEYVAFGPDGRTVITSMAPSSTGGKLEGTSRLTVRFWQLRDLIQSACNLLPPKDRDFAVFRSLARVDVIGCSD